MEVLVKDVYKDEPAATPLAYPSIPHASCPVDLRSSLLHIASGGLNREGDQQEAVVDPMFNHGEQFLYSAKQFAQHMQDEYHINKLASTWGKQQSKVT